MMDIYMMQHNYQFKYLVVINENNHVSVYKYEKCKFDQPLLCFKPKHIFIRKSRVCPMTEFSGAADNSSTFDRNTLLLECQDNEFVYISGLEIIKFKTDDKFIDYISLIGNNMVLYAIMVGEKYTYFIAHYKFIENEKIEEGTLLNSTDNILDPYVSHLEKCGEDSFKKLERSLIHSFNEARSEDIEDESKEDEDEEDDIEEDDNLIERQNLNGNNEVVKIFNQKCVICYERDSVYAFRQCGYQCIREQCYQNRGDIDILKCVVCRTQLFCNINE